jgi:NADH-quinone oxidoreductase subunit F
MIAIGRNPERYPEMDLKRVGSTSELEAWRQRIRNARVPGQLRITVCGGTGCRANGSVQVAETFARELAKRNLKAKVELKVSGCHGFCQQGPVVAIDPAGIFYRMVGRENVEMDVADIIEQTILHGQPVERLLYENPETGEKILRYNEIPFYAKQMRIALKNNGKIDPNNIEDYIAEDGYMALAKVLKSDPEAVINWISASGLRGRGGGGFPTGKKWSLCRSASDNTMRYIICNADEGDPGAFMDRSIMEGDPHSVLEGMVIGAYAMSRGICSAEGYIYIRAEYPLAVETVRTAIRQAEDAGLLGDCILGTDFGFHVKVKEGAGAFVCGEETALMASIEGKRGMPRSRPPFPAQKGLFGKPSNINNVETWANVSKIINGGPEWYAGIGTATSKGTKVFSLVGKIRNSGLVEVPMGTSLREIVFGLGGGIPDDKMIKAVQTGGPSGGCIPAALLDIAVDYEKLAEVGTIMGSGGLVVMDEDTCMVDIARYFVDFTQNESCGKCVPCRLGTRQMLTILNRITSGQGCPGDIDLLLEIGAAIKQGSLCGLGQTAPNPVLTTIRYFRDEYEAHIKRKKCPAGVCRKIVGAPCRHTCPAGINVPRYVRYIAAGRYADALDVIRERIPFPSVCGYVCFHPCEAKCRRAQIDDAVAVRALKRFAAERGVRRRMKATPRHLPTGKRVAIVGSGPAGLTAAYYLGKLGHEVTIFEKKSAPGGMLHFGIPDFRLPHDVLDKEIQSMKKAAGFRIRTNASVSSVESLQKKGYDAVMLAYGADKGLKMGITGEDGAGVFDGVDFLRRVNSGERVSVGEKVVVVGGGSSAIDAARAALRLGAHDVKILYRRTRTEMPAADEEVEEAIEEGVKIEFLTVPVAIQNKDNRLNIRCIRMKLGVVDSSGRKTPEQMPGSEFDIGTDALITAIGQAPEAMAQDSVKVDRQQRLVADEETMATNRPGVFAAGDVVTGPASVIEAIAAGRQAACSIDRYLGGKGNIDEILAPKEEPVLDPLPEEQIRPRSVIPTRSAVDRIADNKDVEITYSEESALMEASRCLRCDLEIEDE